MDQSHWDKKPSREGREDVVPAPDLDMQKIADSLESSGDAEDRREAEREARKALYEVDKWEAAQEGISVGELRQRRYDESQAQEETPEPDEQPKVSDGPAIADTDDEPVDLPAEDRPQQDDRDDPALPLGEGETEEAESDDPIVALLTAIATDLAEIKDAVTQDRQGGVHG